MNEYNRSFGAVDARTMDTSVNAGLRTFMLGVYQKLALGIALSGGIAFLVGSTPALYSLLVGTPLVYVFQFGPLALILGSAFLMRNPSPLATGVLYWTIVVMLGVCLSIWVAMASAGMGVTTRGGASLSPTFYTMTKAFLLTASAFGALSLFGYTTKMNLRPIGIIAVFALWGVVGISLLSLLFPPSGMFELLVQIGVLGISGVLVAFQTQELKEGYFVHQGDQRSLAVMTNWGALNFFIMFYNMFTILMSLLSSRE
jgi:FtsH-binding integral membrane protein